MTKQVCSLFFFRTVAIHHYCWLQSRFLLETLIVIKLLPLCLLKRLSLLNCFDMQQFDSKKD